MASVFTDKVSGSMDDLEKASVHMSRILDYLGYSPDMVQFRKRSYLHQNKILRNPNKQYSTFTSGSKGEGLTKPFESDTDCLLHADILFCVEEDSPHLQDQSASICTIDPQYKHQGYTLLKVHHLVTQPPGNLIQNVDGVQVVSSDEFFKDLDRYDIGKTTSYKIHGRSGPALTASLGKHEVDCVATFRTQCPTIINDWVNRPRSNDWPPQALKDAVRRLNGNVVAKGCKNSDLKEHEWRLCFNQIEMIIMHSFSQTHTKLYVLLKIVLKDRIRHHDKNKVITSYVMKNVVFWLAETYPFKDFQERFLLNWIIKALRMLRYSVKKVYLPYFMIPGRNLIGESMTRTDKKRLLKIIDQLIDEGPSMLHKCKRLEPVRQMTHADLLRFGNARDELEKLYLSRANYIYFLNSVGCVRPDLDDNVMKMFLLEVAITCCPWPPYIQDKLKGCFDHQQVIEVLLS